ncbi:type I-F CRISPR-associated helicase Cas3f [Uruburuella testudinis]|uniref:Type I-F CRISPR-associated helicase Cas3f n=1 Tax=Uruburuella testudinis TaxID=1282863 RepID=A0ABY4DU48_9NEIS|nr:type I-F CRISPR-associated helicase Cas3f [Uruburuella testudinis]UOO82562.1 type I-F CRISPR-associated helicase Cas3f [Uruburuella testudinis]
MNILLVSQCRKNAIKETRRILDQFAERCGERTWQTPITQAGLSMLHKLLRRSARKNTAVACYWTHGKNHTELLWIVGDRSQFNTEGRTPTNRSRRNILKNPDENTWQHAASIQIIATLAALLHDFGKASSGFQHKLQGHSREADPYRHEWISLRLFQAMISGCHTDEQWLQRLAGWAAFETGEPNWVDAIIREPACQYDFSTLPPLARWVAWLIASHHRLPFYNEINYSDGRQRKQLQRSNDPYLHQSIEQFFQNLRPADYWVHNPHSQADAGTFWQWHARTLPTQSKSWQKAIARWAGKALNHPPLFALSDGLNPLLLHLSRLSLMVGDHNYSSLKADAKQRKSGDSGFPLAANTDLNSQIKQTLDEHLIGVGAFTARFARLLPQLTRALPAIGKHKAFSRRTTHPRFQWQNHAYDLAARFQTASEQQGFFGVNLASTGCGKTLGNARIMYALANPQRGARFTIALGLRTLTLQTGQALRTKLNLNEEHLAVLVGGKAVHTLFEHHQPGNGHDYRRPSEHLPTGSESAQALLDPAEIPDAPELLSGGADETLFGTVIADGKARQLLYSPLVSCTIDHLMQLSEQQRGGRYIAPMLRLLSADLILDEPDDFNQADLPALSRLVYWAGMLGSRILLSSATLTPDFVCGLQQAYREGRKIWNAQQGLPDLPVVCAWFDEHRKHAEACTDTAAFSRAHHTFTAARAAKLAAAPARRKADWLPLDNADHRHIADRLLQAAARLHQQEAQTCPNSGKQISIGLIRFANIQPMLSIAHTLLTGDAPPDTAIHLACYHARQLLLLRSKLENTLDRLLDRHHPEALFHQPEIQAALQHSSAKNHIFIILGTPVTEVGRDHDYDWAIVEPSSMRSIIQLAGRVWRHRSNKTATHANILIMSHNLRALSNRRRYGKDNDKINFTHPGFESAPDFCLDSDTARDLLDSTQINPINSLPRLLRSDFPMPLPEEGRRYYTNLAALEHAAMQTLLNPDHPNLVTAYRTPGSAAPLSAHTALISPFRLSRPHEDYICLPDGEGGYRFKLAENAYAHPYDDTGNDNHIFHPAELTHSPNIFPWLTANLTAALTELEQQTDQPNPIQTALKFATLSLPKSDSNRQISWHFNEWSGFWWT